MSDVQASYSQAVVGGDAATSGLSRFVTDCVHRLKSSFQDGSVMTISSSALEGFLWMARHVATEMDKRYFALCEVSAWTNALNFESVLRWIMEVRAAVSEPVNFDGTSCMCARIVYKPADEDESQGAWITYTVVLPEWIIPLSKNGFVVIPSDALVGNYLCGLPQESREVIEQRAKDNRGSVWDRLPSLKVSEGTFAVEAMRFAEISRLCTADELEVNQTQTEDDEAEEVKDGSVAPSLTSGSSVLELACPPGPRVVPGPDTRYGGPLLRTGTRVIPGAVLDAEMARRYALVWFDQRDRIHWVIKATGHCSLPARDGFSVPTPREVAALMQCGWKLSSMDSEHYRYRAREMTSFAEVVEVANEVVMKANPKVGATLQRDYAGTLAKVPVCAYPEGAFLYLNYQVGPERFHRFHTLRIAFRGFGDLICAKEYLALKAVPGVKALTRDELNGLMASAARSGEFVLFADVNEVFLPGGDNDEVEAVG
jgi:hypothetical protein